MKKAVGVAIKFDDGSELEFPVDFPVVAQIDRGLSSKVVDNIVEKHLSGVEVLVLISAPEPYLKQLKDNISMQVRNLIDE